MKQHSFFRDLDWTGLLRQKAEFIPHLLVFVLQQEAELSLSEDHKAVEPAAHQSIAVLFEPVLVVQRQSSGLAHARTTRTLAHT